MKLMFVRHAEPWYAIDSLTEKGHREAALLADRLAKLDVKAFYSSPLGRARETARYTLEKVGREAEVLPWLAVPRTLHRPGERPPPHPVGLQALHLDAPRGPSRLRHLAE